MEGVEQVLRCLFVNAVRMVLALSIFCENFTMFRKPFERHVKWISKTVSNWFSPVPGLFPQCRETMVAWVQKKGSKIDEELGDSATELIQDLKATKISDLLKFKENILGYGFIALIGFLVVSYF